MCSESLQIFQYTLQCISQKIDIWQVWYTHRHISVQASGICMQPIRQVYTATVLLVCANIHVYIYSIGIYTQVDIGGYNIDTYIHTSGKRWPNSLPMRGLPVQIYTYAHDEITCTNICICGLYVQIYICLHRQAAALCGHIYAATYMRPIIYKYTYVCTGKRRLYAANAGDARAVLCRGDKAIRCAYMRFLYHVCVYTYVYIFLCMFIYVYICSYMFVYLLNVYAYVCTEVYVSSHRYAYTHMYTRMYIEYIQVHIYIHTYIHTYRCLYIAVEVYPWTLTHVDQHA